MKILTIREYGHYLLKTAWDDLKLQYAGTVLGSFWNIVFPLSVVAIYSVVFTHLIGRHAVSGTRHVPYYVYLCSGLLPWLTFSKTLQNTSNAFLGNAQYITKLAVPEDLFVAIIALREFYTLIMFLALLIVAGLFGGHVPGWPSLLLPVVALLMQSVAFGMGLFFATLRVFFLDISQVLDLTIRLWIWTLPVVYFESILPEILQRAVRWNPLYPFVHAFRDLYIYGRMPHALIAFQMVMWVFLFVLLGYGTLIRYRKDLRDCL